LPKFIKRGRPAISDRSQVKTSTMTICLSPLTHERLVRYSSKYKDAPAKVVRSLIEERLQEDEDNDMAEESER